MERRLTEKTCISTLEGPGERSDWDGGDDGDGTGDAGDCFSVDSHSEAEDLRMSLSESHHCESSPSSAAISGSLSDSECASCLDYDGGELGSMDSDWLSDVLLSDCQDDYDSWSSLFASDSDEHNTSLQATVPRGQQFRERTLCWGDAVHSRLLLGTVSHYSEAQSYLLLCG